MSCESCDPDKVRHIPCWLDLLPWYCCYTFICLMLLTPLHPVERPLCSINKDALRIKEKLLLCKISRFPYLSYIGSGASWPSTVSVFNLFFKPNYLKHINLLQFETNWPIKPNIPSNFCRCNGFLQWFYQSYFTTNKSGRWYNFIRCPANQKSWNWKRKERTQTIMCHSLFRLLLRLDIETQTAEAGNQSWLGRNNLTRSERSIKFAFV